MVHKKRGINTRLDAIDRKIQVIAKEEARIEKEEKVVEKKIDSLAKEEDHIEKIVLKVWNFNVRRKHLVELLRASAGAFLGVGIGRGLIGLDNVARNLGWFNVLGILFFVLGISALLIYKDQKEKIKTDGTTILLRRLFFIYAISVLIEFISLVLFQVPYDSFEGLLKILIVGSYTAMASAITFSLAR